ncbi:MAG TPA: hypothetical protein VH637_10715 [Streptosporangiaceae bacterium]|jgi:hypothetical protein
MSAPEPPARQSRRFPVLDDEPPPRPLWRRLLAPTAVVVVAGLVAAGVAAWPRSGPGSRHRAESLTRLTAAGGRILSVAVSGELVLSGPAGNGPVSLHALGQIGQSIYPATDDKYFSLDNGQVLAVTGSHPPARAKTKIGLFTLDITGSTLGAFADHDRELVALVSPGYGTQTRFKVVLYSLATGRPVTLGIGHNAAGDPQAPGVFATVIAPVRATSATSNVIADSRIELRDLGHPVRLLASTADLERDLHLSPRGGAALTPYPSPSGDAVAVTVRPRFGSSTAGVVILSRSGRVLGTIPVAAGPAAAVSTGPFTPPAGGGVAWSPSGQALAFPAPGRSGPGLSVWTRNGRLRKQAFPKATAAEYKSCLWSPDGQSIICASGGIGQQWVVATMAAHVMTPVHGPGVPVAWLP